MIVTFFRSSSYNAWDMCPHSYFFEYVLGWRAPSGKKAILGSIVHKALEGLARKKLAAQNGDPTFYDAELDTTFDAAAFTPEQGIRTAFDFYSTKETHHKWTEKDFALTSKWQNDLLAMNGGRWSPLNMKVVQPEQFFDFTLPYPWAAYKYKLPGGEVLEGQLGLKGAVDLITEEDSDTLHYVDWKSGMRKNWATGEPKDWKKLRDDPQLRLYHYALAKHYPSYRFILMSIVFIQDGGPFTLDFGPRDLPKTEQMVRERFEAIRDCQVPPRIIKDKSQNWRCQRLCHFGKTESEERPGTTVCQDMHDQIVTLGMDRVVARNGRSNAFNNYGGGGGVSNRDMVPPG